MIDHHSPSSPSMHSVYRQYSTSFYINTKYLEWTTSPSGKETPTKNRANLIPGQVPRSSTPSPSPTPSSFIQSLTCTPTDRPLPAVLPCFVQILILRRRCAVIRLSVCPLDLPGFFLGDHRRVRQVKSDNPCLEDVITLTNDTGYLLLPSPRESVRVCVVYFLNHHHRR